MIVAVLSSSTKAPTRKPVTLRPAAVTDPLPASIPVQDSVPSFRLRLLICASALFAIVIRSPLEPEGASIVTDELEPPWPEPTSVRF